MDIPPLLPVSRQYPHPYKQRKRRVPVPITEANTKLVGDKNEGKLFYCKYPIMKWNRNYVWFYTAGNWRLGGPCTVKRWRECATYIGIRFCPFSKGNKLRMWFMLNTHHGAFRSGQRYPRSMEAPVITHMATVKRPKHYDQEVMQPVIKWAERKPNYVKVVLLARRKVGGIVIQVMQYGDEDFYYEAFLPSAFRFAKNDILARARFRSYDRAVQAFGADHVTLLEPLERELVHIDREDLPFHD